MVYLGKVCVYHLGQWYLLEEAQEYIYMLQV